MKQRTIRSLILSLVTLIGALCAVGYSARAQDTNPQMTAGMTTGPKVTQLEEGRLALDTVFRVRIEHLAAWALTHDSAKLVPYLNGLAITGNYPMENHASQDHLHFRLKITPESKPIWIQLLGQPQGFRKPVTFSVGLENQAPFQTEYHQRHRVPLMVIAPLSGLISLLVILLTLLLFLWLARTTAIIREPGPGPASGKLKPYNLGRTQMAFWFFMVSTSYIVIWLITSDLDTITPSLLGLMGLSAGTALGEALIDSGKDAANVSQLRGLTAEKQTLEQNISELQSQLATISAQAASTADTATNRDTWNAQLQDNRTRLYQINQQIKDLTPATADNVSDGFLQDILSDANGYSFHRFQIFAWTIVLGMMFVVAVYNNLTMPEFSATLLGLLGISAGTYIGFKFPEQQ